MNNITNNNEDYFLADWISGKISDNELKEKVSSEDFLEYQKMRKSFDVLQELEAPLDNTLLKIKESIGKTNTDTPKKSKVISLYTKWAVSIAASFLLFFSVYNYFGSNDITIDAGFGEQKEFALLDGSEVILNAKSTLSYNKKDWENNRELFLDGEAYFKVTKGNKFTVNTKNGSVTVLGTQFNVNSKDGYFDVICYEGKVRVADNNTQIVSILTPGKAVKTIEGKHIEWTLNTTAPDWISGQSTFKNVPLKIVIDALEKQFNITFDRTAIDDTVNFTGSFDNKKLNLALASVFKPMNIKYQINNKIVILSK